MNDQQRIIKLEKDVERLTKFVKQLLLKDVPEAPEQEFYVPEVRDKCQCHVGFYYDEQILDGDCMECGQEARMPEPGFCRCGAATEEVSMKGDVNIVVTTCLNKSCSVKN